MRTHLPLCAFAALLGGSAAFSPSTRLGVSVSSTPGNSALYGSSMPNPGSDDKVSSAASSASSSVEDSVDEFKSRADLGSFAQNVEKMKENALVGDGKIGSRGEVWTGTIGLLILCVAFGDIPVIGGLANLIFGPGLLIGGLALFVVAGNDLGDNLSPWPKPVGTSGIVSTGLYARLRHPMYTGLIATLVGASIVSDSASRLLLTGILTLVLNLVVEKEEEFLAEAYPSEFGTYKTQVPGKFFPQDLVDQLPWNKKDAP